MFRQYWRLSDRIFLYLQICYASLKPKYQNKRIYRMISRVFVGGCFGAAKLPEINVWYWQEKLVALVSDVQKYNCIYIHMEQAYSWRYGLIVNKKLYKISVNSILRLLYSFSISILFTIFVWFYFSVVRLNCNRLNHFKHILNWLSICSHSSWLSLLL